MTSSPTRIVHAALGSNLASPVGDRLATMAAALRQLAADGDILVVARSHAYETDPVPAGQPMYLNAAVALATALPAHRLLERAQGVERALGRDRRTEQRWGPRTIDIDLLVDGESVLGPTGQASPAGTGTHVGSLTLPHPRMTERTFVLLPLAEIAAGLRVPPGGATVAELLDRLLGGAPAAGIRRFAAIPD